MVKGPVLPRILGSANANDAAPQVSRNSAPASTKKGMMCLPNINDLINMGLAGEIHFWAVKLEKWI
jgi:hypothetical protein